MDHEGTARRYDAGAMSDRLTAFLGVVEPARPVRAVSYEPISGGYSRVSGRARVTWSDGAQETFVLRAWRTSRR